MKDKENLAAVAAELLLLRSGMNLLYLLGNAEKNAQAELLAVLLVGFTGMHGIIKVTQLLILVVWAQAEGIHFLAHLSLLTYTEKETGYWIARSKHLSVYPLSRKKPYNNLPHLQNEYEYQKAPIPQ